ncbi:pyridoxal-phosphate dependent enzyme [Pseudomonadota bacterium]
MSTPLVHSPALSKRCGKDIWLKRDDMFHPICKGPKGRRIFKLITAAIALGATDIITSGAAWSNQAEMLAKMAVQHRFQLHFQTTPPQEPADEAVSLTKAVGERLDRLRSLGVNVIEIEAPKWPFHGLNAVKLQRKLTREGRKTVIISLGATELTALDGTIDLADELLEEVSGFSGEVLVALPCGTASTAFGLELGFQLHGSNTRPEVLALSVDLDVASALNAVDLFFEQYSQQHAQSFQRSDHIRVEDARGKGYGWVSSEDLEFAEDIFTQTGLYLDPIYQVGPLRQLLKQTALGAYDEFSSVVYVVTGEGGLLPHLASRVYQQEV